MNPDNIQSNGNGNGNGNGNDIMQPINQALSQSRQPKSKSQSRSHSHSQSQSAVDDVPKIKLYRDIQLWWRHKTQDQRSFLCAALFGLLMVLLLSFIYFIIPVLHQPLPCDGNEQCYFSLVESIPYGMNTTLVQKYTIQNSLVQVINNAKKTLDITCFYMTLRSNIYPGQGEEKGEAVFNAILAAARRGVSVRIASSHGDMEAPTDLIELQRLGVAEVRYVNMPALFQGGVLHTKFVLSDDTDFFLGSANMDWRSFTQVKELGIHMWNCPCMGSDLSKIFDIYWSSSNITVLPTSWPSETRTQMNGITPGSVHMNGITGPAYICSAPLPFCSGGRSFDRDCIVDAINNASKSVYIEVMDYSPTTLFANPKIYWPYFDTAIRDAAFRGVQVNFLGGLWNHTKPDMVMYLKSLNELSNVDVKFFQVPPVEGLEEQIPFTRVNHAKFLVTEKTALIGTSNWSGDYFEDTAGVSFVSRHSMLREDLESVFLRDWYSPYSMHVNDTWPVMDKKSYVDRDMENVLS